MNTTIIHKCVWCPQRFTITVPTDGYQAWHKGELIQRALPDVDINTREQLITGCCYECLDNIYDDDDDE